MTCDKLKVLNLNKIIFRYLGISLERYPDKNEFFRSVAMNIFMVASYFVVIACSATYIWTHADDVENTIFSTMQFVAYAAIFGTYVSLALRKDSILEFFHNMEGFVDERKRQNSDTFIYEIAEKHAILVTKWPLLLFSAYLTAILLAMATYTLLFEILLGSSEPKTWLRMFKMSSLLNENTICGYFVDVLIYFIAMHAYIGMMTAGVGYFLSVCFYLNAFCSDFALQLKKIDRLVSSNETNRPNRIESEIFQDIKFHVSVIGFYERFSKLVSGMIFFQIVSGSVFVSTTIYLLYVSSGNYSFQTFVTIASALASIVTVTPMCYCSTVIMTKLQGIGNTIYGSKWYTLSPKSQKYYMLSIAVAQQPRYFTGYGIVQCSLQMLQAILNTSFSFFLMFTNLPH